MSFTKIFDASITTAKMSSFVFLILIGASMFSLVFRGFGGDDMISEFLNDIPGGKFAALFLVMATIFVLGFFLDYIEIIFVIAIGSIYFNENFETLVYIGMFLVTFGVVFNVTYFKSDKQNI